MTVARLPARRRTGVPVRLAVAILLGAVVLGVGGGILLREGDGTSAAAAAPRASLPAFHGQGSWKRGERPAPDFALHDQNGTLVSLRSLRGKPVLLTFLDSQCTTRCPIEGRQLGSVLRRLPAGDRPAIVVVSVDRAGDTPRGIRHALAKWHLTGHWTIHWLNAPSQARLAAVWRLYDIQVEPTSNDIVHSLALYLIDRRGDERTAYLFPFLQSFVQHDLARLARERA